LKQIIVITSISLAVLLGACSAPPKTVGGGFDIPVNEEYGDGSIKSKKADSLALSRVFIDACRAKALGDFEGAVTLFGEVLRAEPLNDAALYELGRIYFEFGKLDDAREMLRLATEQDPFNPYYLEVYGNVLLYLAQYREAVTVYRQLSLLQPDNMDAYFELAFAYERSGDVKESIRTLQELEAQFGEDEGILMEEYRVYLRSGQLEEAIEVLSRLIAANPVEPVYYGMLSEIYEMAEKTELAEAAFEKLLALDPDNADLLFKKAEFQRKAGDTAGFFQTLRSVFSNPDAGIDKKVFFFVPYVDSVDIKGFPLTDTILDLAALVVQAHPTDPKGYAIQGDLLYYAKRLEEARKSYVQSTSLRGDIYDVWIKLFYIDADQENWDSLKAITQRSKELFPNQALGYYFGGVAAMNTNNHETAVQEFKRALPMAGSNSQLKGEIWLRLGDTYHEMGKHTDSDAAYDQSLNIDPNNPYTLNNYAYYLSLRGEQLEKAAAMSQKANRLVPNNPSLLDTYAWVLYKQGKYSEAENTVLQAIAAGGESSAVLAEHYGDILFRLGREADALTQWKKAKELGGKGELLDKKINEGKLYE
jgi:tetratricopeptide (TPR) repeat protein